MLHIKFKNGCACTVTIHLQNVTKCLKSMEMDMKQMRDFFYLHKKMHLFNCVCLQGCFFQITSWINGENGKLSAHVHTNVYLNIVL